ncbi:MAG: hypothetical protein F6K31_00485 [Symploca sp. SIO2G7]|nr:hypothetical protein [Symploca sp. SIO2G7]
MDKTLQKVIFSEILKTYPCELPISPFPHLERPRVSASPRLRTPFFAHPRSPVPYTAPPEA